MAYIGLGYLILFGVLITLVMFLLLWLGTTGMCGLYDRFFSASVQASSSRGEHRLQEQRVTDEGVGKFTPISQ